MHHPHGQTAMWADRFSQSQADAEARLQKAKKDLEMKEFWAQYEKSSPDQKFRVNQPNNKKTKESTTDFFRRTLSKVGFFRRASFHDSSSWHGSSWSSGWRPAPKNVRRIMFGSTDGFNQGLSNAGVGLRVPEESIRLAFREIDRNQDGLVNTREIVKAIRRCGIDVSKQNVLSLLQESGFGDGNINSEQFVKFFRTCEEVSVLMEEDVDPCAKKVMICQRFLLIVVLLTGVVMGILFLRMNEAEEPTTYMQFRLTLIVLGALLPPLVCCTLVRPLLNTCLQGDSNRSRQPVRPAQEVKADPARTKTTTAIKWLDDVYEGEFDRHETGLPHRAARKKNLMGGYEDEEAYDPSLYRLALEAAQEVRTPVQAFSAGGGAGGKFSAGALSAQALGFSVASTSTPQASRAPSRATSSAQLPAAWSRAQSGAWPSQQAKARHHSQPHGAAGSWAWSGLQQGGEHVLHGPGTAASPAAREAAWSEAFASGSQAALESRAAGNNVGRESPLTSWLQGTSPEHVQQLESLHQQLDQSWTTSTIGAPAGEMQHSSLPAVPENKPTGNGQNSDLELMDCD